MKFTHLLFDMDNTIYPASSAMNDGITRRMLECVADFFKCDMERAVELRKERIIHYSTTLEWLRDEGLTDIEGFLAHVHPENEADELLEQPGLRDFLLSLPYPKSILHRTSTRTGFFQNSESQTFSKPLPTSAMQTSAENRIRVRIWRLSKK